MDVDNPAAVAIDVVVIISAGLLFQSLKQLARKKAYPVLAHKLFSLKNDQLKWHFSKQFWKLTWHLSCFILELSTAIPSDFWPSVINPYGSKYGTSLLWEYETNELPSTGIRVLYLIQIGYYIFDSFYITLIDRTNDYLTMLVHHIATLALLWMSYSPPTTFKIGCAILIYHEFGDVSLYLCKTLHYAQFELTSNILFVIHIMIWIWTRLIWFPRVICSLYIDIPSSPKYWQVWPCTILLFTLLILHIYWTYLMLRVLYKAVVKKEAMADHRDKDNPMVGRENNDGGDVDTEKQTEDDQDKMDMNIDKMDQDKVNLDDIKPMEIVADRTDNLDENEQPKPPLMKRRSSLMGSYIEDKEKIVTPDNKADAC